ncbi:uncharacterized protein LOC124437012 [Xenia sp. Carnegie-2017]|uniref:uncharacterized protein LOC124437012 n=1 Tax=Xenia sp. Carnegie-2017 TaxID=2897299 RepID=UPI001F037A65|nr:uncharacterized protein LOC124437012 [Xenia sp. Carnegie-2017]
MSKEIEKLQNQGRDADRCYKACRGLLSTSIFPSTTTSATTIDLTLSRVINATTTIAFINPTSTIHMAWKKIHHQLPGNTSSETSNKTVTLFTTKRTVIESSSQRGFWKNSWVPPTFACLVVIVTAALGVILKLFVCKRGKNKQINEGQNVLMASSSDGSQIASPGKATSHVMDLHENLTNKFFEGSH